VDREEEGASAAIGAAGASAGVLTIPNAVTVLRLLCIPLFVYLLFGRDDRAAAAWLLGFVGATDWVDGWLARRLGQVSAVGKVLDPTADRLVFLVGVTALLIDGSVPVWFGVLTLVREVVVAVAVLVLAALGARRIDVTFAGKTATFGLLFAFPLFLASHSDLFFADQAGIAAWILGPPSLALSWWAAGGYVPQARAALRDGRRKAQAGPAIN
jgi:cardiolipin synthase